MLIKKWCKIHAEARVAWPISEYVVYDFANGIKYKSLSTFLGRIMEYYLKT